MASHLGSSQPQKYHRQQAMDSRLRSDSLFHRPLWVRGPVHPDHQSDWRWHRQGLPPTCCRLGDPPHVEGICTHRQHASTSLQHEYYTTLQIQVYHKHALDQGIYFTQHVPVYESRQHVCQPLCKCNFTQHVPVYESRQHVCQPLCKCNYRHRSSTNML